MRGAHIFLLATIETLLVVPSRRRSGLSKLQAQNKSLARYRLQSRNGLQVRLGSILAARAALAIAGANATVYLGILLGL